MNYTIDVKSKFTLSVFYKASFHDSNCNYLCMKIMLIFLMMIILFGPCLITLISSLYLIIFSSLFINLVVGLLS